MEGPHLSGTAPGGAVRIWWALAKQDPGPGHRADQLLISQEGVAAWAALGGRLGEAGCSGHPEPCFQALPPLDTLESSSLGVKKELA